MKIGIAGYGFVGRAHYEVLKDKHDVVISDPALGFNNSFDDVDAVIVCVSTPQDNDGKCNMSNVFDVINTVPNVPILIKSTISLEGWDMLVDAFFDRNINFSPEFLRAKSAVEDLMNQKLLLVGGFNPIFWADVFNISVEVAEPGELILAKYFRNSFLATKVSFFNQVYDLCNAANVEYSAVAHYITEDIRIGDSHTYITTERGFGGHCFSKDTAAILRTAENKSVELSLIKEARIYNDKIRK